MNVKYWTFVKQLMKIVKTKECKPCKFVESNKKYVNTQYTKQIIMKKQINNKKFTIK